MSVIEKGVGVAEKARRQQFNGSDVAEIVVGSLVLAFPVAVTEEVWNLSTELSLTRVMLVSAASLVFISFFVHVCYEHDFTAGSQKSVAARVFSVYGLTLLVCAGVLFAVDRLPLFDDLLIAGKRIVLVAFPASFAATVVDGLRD